MKNKDILLLDQTLPDVSPPEMDGWFNYAVEETIQRAAAKAISIRKVIAPKEKMVEYQEKIKKLQEKHAEEDEYGEPMKTLTPIGGGRQIEKFIIAEIDNPRGKFNVALKALEKKYKEAIDEYDKGLKFLDEENPDFEPYWTKADLIPKGLSRIQMKAIFLMIKKEDAKKA